jgi:predicted RecA/RadA family phage recombinase
MEQQIQVIQQADVLAAINSSEIDSQVATAHKFPRDVEQALKKIEMLACVDEETAADCFYVLHRNGAAGDTTIEGLSVRMAEIIASCWGNLRVQARIINNDGKYITAQGVCHDLESNYAVSKEVRRRITDRSGRTYSEDMQVVTGNAACAIAMRNAVLAVVPKAVTNAIVKRVKKIAMGASLDIPTARQQMINYFARLGVTVDQLCAYLQIGNIGEITKEHIFTMRATAQAIKEGTTTVRETFVLPAQQASDADKAKKAAEEAKARAEKAAKK